VAALPYDLTSSQHRDQLLARIFDALLNGGREPTTTSAAKARPRLLASRALTDKQRNHLGQPPELAIGLLKASDRIRPQRQQLLAFEEQVCPTRYIYPRSNRRPDIPAAAAHGWWQAVRHLGRWRTPVKL
jgi:hypothetical protein